MGQERSLLNPDVLGMRGDNLIRKEAHLMNFSGRGLEGSIYFFSFFEFEFFDGLFRYKTGKTGIQADPIYMTEMADG